MEEERDDPLTWRQAVELQRLLPKGTPIGHLSRYKAAGLIKLHSPNAAWRGEPATPRQEAFLRRHGQWQPGLTRGAASDRIAAILSSASGR